MTTKTSAPAEGESARGNSCNCLFTGNGCKCNDNWRQRQVPIMGSALRAFLRRYRDDLRPVAERGERVATSMLECCDLLLIESDRLERGRA